MNMALVTLGVEMFFLLGIVGIFHKFRSKIGSDILILLLSVFIVIVQWLSDVGSVISYQEYLLFFSSVVFFPAILFGLFLVFVFDGPMLTRKLFYGLLIGELGYVIAMFFLLLLDLVPTYIQLDIGWARNHLFSTVAVICDFYFITYVWSLMSKRPHWVFTKILAVFLGVLWIDTTIFVLGAFGELPALVSILQSNLIVRALLALIVTPFAYLYVLLESKSKGFRLETRYPWSIQVTSDEVQEKLQQANVKISQLEELQQRLQEMSLIADKTTSGVVITSSTGAITWVNDGFTAMTGYSLDDVRGTQRQAILTEPASGQSGCDQFEKGIESRKAFSTELLQAKKTGEQLWIHADVTPIFDGDVLVKFISVESDISSLRVAQEKMEEANKQLRETNSLMVGRELKMTELKEELARLRGTHG